MRTSERDPTKVLMISDSLIMFNSKNPHCTLFARGYTERNYLYQTIVIICVLPFASCYIAVSIIFNISKL